MGLFHIATSCLRYLLHLLLALLDDESSHGPLLGGFPPAATEVIPMQSTIYRESESSNLLSSSASHRFSLAPNHATPLSKFETPYVCHRSDLNVKAHQNALLSRQQQQQQPYMARLMYKEPARHSSIKSSSSITLDQSPCDVPSLLNGELPPPSCTSTSVSSRSSMASTPILPSWSPETPMTPTRQPIHKATAGGGKLVGLGIQIMYDEERSRQFDGLGLVPSRMRNPDTTEEEDLGVPSRILLEEIYQTFTSSDALAAATAAPFHEETDLGDGETSVEDVFMARNVIFHGGPGPNAASTPRKLIKKRSRMSYGLPTAASKRRARQMRMVDTEEGDESRSSDSSGGSALKPAWRY